LAGTLAVANGGSGATTAQGAINAFAGAVTLGYYLRGDGTNVTMSAIQSADVPTLNQNTTGTAANVTGTVAVANGGSGVTTAQAAMNAFAGAVTNGYYLRGNGTNVVMAALGAADITGTLAVGNGGTGLTTIAALSIPVANALNTYTTVTPTAGQSVRINAGGTAWEAYTPSSGTGTVTSVGWTGGIVSIATATTTPAFTIAGTSGGIPYFSSATGWASSGLLAANAIVLGGGAGVAPGTTTTGSGVVTAIGSTVNTTGGLVTQSGTLATSALLLGGGSGNAITSTTTGTGVVTAVGIAVNTTGGLVTQSGALAASAIMLGGGSGSAVTTTTTGTGVVTAVGNAVNTASGLVTQSGTLTASALLLGGGSATAISSTTTGTGVVTALGIAANAATGFTTGSGTATLTNKRIDPRVTSAASASSLTPDISAADQYAYTALAANLTINAPTGTPVDGDKLIFRFLDNGTARTLTWNATYTVIGVTLPTTTTISKTVYIGCIYNANNTRWDVIAVTTQA
jgi:hypothetical protein